MSLIDESYFFGPLTIPQLGHPSVVDDLNALISLHETRFLKAALGYELYQDFVASLQLDPVPQIWLNLRDGVDFQATGMWPPFSWDNGYLNGQRDWFIPQNPARRRHWVGFTGGGPSNGGSSQTNGSVLVLTVDSATDPDNNPVSGMDMFTLAKLAGTTYTIELRGFGTLIPGVDVSITNNSQTITLLQDDAEFVPGQVYILHFSAAPSSGTPSPQYLSPIAGYVYYEWFRDQAVNLSSSGTVKGNTQNATPVSPMLKMSDAFRQMSSDMMELWAYLDLQNVAVYPDYDRLKIDYNYFKPVNPYGL